MNYFKFFLISAGVLFLAQCSQEEQTGVSRTIVDLPPLELTNTPFEREVSLGRILFYDPALSYNNTISCASCHKQSMAFTDQLQFSQGLYGELTTRNSMALVNLNGNRAFFWEGHSGSLGNHILNPVSNHIEMGMMNTEELVTKLKNNGQYVERFSEVFLGFTPITEETISRALTSFVNSLVSENSKFDVGEELDFANFDIGEEKGMEIFYGKGKCASCHKGDDFVATWRRNANIGLDMEYKDQGAGDGKFKVPTLRNIELTPPYMHDGRFETLEEVVEHYSSGIQDHPEIDWTLSGGSIDLTNQEKADLVAFLKTLTDWEFVTEPRFSNPFN